MQRDGQRRVEEWLRVLADEGALAGEDSLTQLEAETLCVSVDAGVSS